MFWLLLLRGKGNCPREIGIKNLFWCQFFLRKSPIQSFILIDALRIRHFCIHLFILFHLIYRIATSYRKGKCKGRVLAIVLLTWVRLVTRSRGVARNLLRGTKEWIWGTEVLLRGPGAEPEGVLRQNFQKPETNANFQLQGDMHPCLPLATPLTRSAFLEVAADWHELMIPWRITRPSVARANEQLDIPPPQ